MNEQIAALIATRRWSAENAEISARAGHKCEYCDLDFFESLTCYRLWQKDHIIPITAGGKDEIDNYAASCFPCNVIYKSQWNPESVAGCGASREDLVAAVREYVAKRRSSDETQINTERTIIGWRR